MKIAISGSTGFIGGNLSEKFSDRGWDVIPLKRNDFKENILKNKLNRADAVVNLAGAPIIKRWTEKNKKEIYNSRISTTAKIVSAIKECESKPSVFVSASAVGIYRDDEIYTEDTDQFAEGFMADVCKDWEEAALEASDIVRTVILRIGVVLGKGGGALQKLIVPFKLGLGGPVAGGKQKFSWVHLSDLIRMIEFAVEKEEMYGTYNATAPDVTTNSEFTRILAKTLSRPAFIPIPSFALKIVYGKGAATLTEGQGAYPRKLMDKGFDFRFSDLQKALADIIKSSRVRS